MSQTDDDFVVELACGSDYPVTTAVPISVSFLFGLITLTVAGTTLFRLRQNQLEAATNEMEYQRHFRILYYVQFAYLICCCIYGISQPLLLVLVCYSSWDRWSFWSQNALWWSVSTVGTLCFVRHKRIDSVHILCFPFQFYIGLLLPLEWLHHHFVSEITICIQRTDARFLSQF